MRIGPLSPYTIEAEVAALRLEEGRSREVVDTVTDIISDVRRRGDEALVEASRRLDWSGAQAATLRVPSDEIEDAFHAADPALLEALEVARDNLTWFHRREVREDWEEAGPQGQLLGIRHQAVRRAGLYVPGGLAAYPSSVVMNAVPARVAGVTDIFICTPPDREGGVNADVLAAAHLMDIDEVYRVGGAQAVAAMALGTETIPPAEVISGPGNAYVNEAKRQVYGVVGIDGLAGPSEVVVVADEEADPRWIAADLLAQAEHGSGAVAVLVGAVESVCRRVEEAVDSLLAERGREAANSRADALAENVAGGATGDAVVGYYPETGEGFFEVALAFVEAYAPEHLELHVVDPRGLLDGVRSAGAVFLGSGTPTAFGDYVAGSNHVLPTGGAARFSSPLSVDTFRKKSWTVDLPAGVAQSLGPFAERLAEREGFPFHAFSARLRREAEE